MLQVSRAETKKRGCPSISGEAKVLDSVSTFASRRRRDRAERSLGNQETEEQFGLAAPTRKVAMPAKKVATSVEVAMPARNVTTNPEKCKLFESHRNGF